MRHIALRSPGTGRNAPRRARSSPLEAVPGVGPRRRQSLLKQFGGLQEVARAGVEDLCKVPGISRTLAQQIYDTFHGDNVRSDRSCAGQYQIF